MNKNCSKKISIQFFSGSTSFYQNGKSNTKMEIGKDLSESFIYAGSEINNTSFGDDESLNYLQSTIFAGDGSLDNISGDLLNINIDAISDDDTFYDCPLYESPRQQFRPTLRIDISPPPPKDQVSSTQFLTNETLHFSDIDLISSSDDYLPDDEGNNENFYKRKYSSAVNIAVPKVNVNVMPKTPVVKRSLKVELMKEFFEHLYCKTSGLPYRNLKSRNSSTIRKTTNERSLNNVKLKKSSQSYARNNQPMFHNQKGKASPIILKKTIVKSRLNSAGSTRNLHNRNSKDRSTRSSSCSEYSKEKLYNIEDSLDSNSSKSKSASDLSYASSSTIELSDTYEINKIIERPYLLVNQRSTLHSKSPKKSPKKQLKVSSIMGRKSLAFVPVRSPVRPVNELRKLFSPAVKLMRNQIKRNVSKVPHIVVNDLE